MKKFPDGILLSDLAQSLLAALMELLFSIIKILLNDEFLVEEWKIRNRMKSETVLMYSIYCPFVLHTYLSWKWKYFVSLRSLDFSTDQLKEKIKMFNLSIVECRNG